ncbi:2Fe-2S iron-sulfur cluster binding domain-containing protein [Mucilaginibacter sp. HMF7410]|uniref:2Fe-2S iron-sulfur cluster binding domain-containing protein n=2 Tax=Mucilaginibacter arboris TaxID=2682090 RepID=A0A7K1SVE8_9SPHI|nr:2Fe-2S iron-sulfur cluster binding domain-containing protein [Mucilaginibacter arboris]
MLQYTLKVAEIRQETQDTVTVVFKQPALKKIKYHSGQYLTLIFRINNRRYIRPYSFSSAPGIDNTLNITVKRVPGGVVSNHIADCLKVGDIVEVMEPMGDFTLENKGINGNSRLILWGAGSGITPLLSLAKFALHHQFARHLTLVYGNRGHESAIFSGQINELQKQYAEYFSVWHFHTKAIVDAAYPYLIQGRINPQTVLSVLKKEGDLGNTVHYICGPAGLKESVKKVLEEEGIGPKQIFSEEFKRVANPKDFENVITRTVSLIKGGKEHAIEVIKGKSILEAGLDAMIDLSYSCQTGNCTVCKGKLLSGQLKSIRSQETMPSLNKDEYLLCCSYPVTENIQIIVD